MTKKILQDFATEIKNLREKAQALEKTDIGLAQVLYGQSNRVAEIVVKVATKHNPRFDVYKFNHACNPSN